MKQNELLEWFELMNDRQSKNDFNVADVPFSVLLELRRRRFANDDNVLTEEGIKFLEKNKVENEH
jgi:hypothetical protein